MVIDVSKNKGMLVGSFKLNESINEISESAGHAMFVYMAMKV